jgi:hypothetical protein
LDCPRVAACPSQAQRKAIELKVVHLSKTTLQVLLSLESDIPVLKGLLSFLVEYYLSGLDLIAYTGEKLEEVKVEEVVLRQVGNVHRWDLTQLSLVFFLVERSLRSSHV